MTEPIVEDLVTENEAQFHLVRPEQPSGPGVMWLHWFDEAPNANRSQFLDEAKTLAGRGVTSVLPQLVFPWHSPPSDLEADLARIDAERRRLLEVLAVLAGTVGVDHSRLALVGHDFGAMHGMNLFAEADLAGAVLVAPTPRWSDWFLRFWEISSDRYDYMRSLEPVDPITTVTRSRWPLLFQFGKTDFYIAAMTGAELFNSAPEPKELLSYESGHAMELDETRRDRGLFLVQQLGIDG